MPNHYILVIISIISFFGGIYVSHTAEDSEELTFLGVLLVLFGFFLFCGSVL